MTSDPLDRARRLARDMAFGSSHSSGPGPDTGGTPGLSPTVVKALRTGGAVLVGSQVLRRSRVARLIVAGGAVTYASRKRGGADTWKDVQAPPDTSR